jgi:hypothetical protein
MNILAGSQSNDAHLRAHDHCYNHRVEIEQSDNCGCFYCISIFSPSEIVEWIDDGKTALCPHCEIDSVIGSASGFSITSEFLECMYRHWF